MTGSHPGTPTADEVIARLLELGDSAIAAHSQRFFKTGPGEYAEGDEFLGIRVPALRKTASAFRRMPLSEVKQLLASPFHEARFCALVILNLQFAGGTATERDAIVSLYLEQIEQVNNWDLVDLSAAKILGAYLEHRDRALLYQLANSENLWQRRISIIATFHFIRRNCFSDTFGIAERLVGDGHDLIHKAVGWMLREVGNRDLPAEEAFLEKHYRSMPRTMLRYAIEKFPAERRRQYLSGTAFKVPAVRA